MNHVAPPAVCSSASVAFFLNVHLPKAAGSSSECTLSSSPSLPQDSKSYKSTWPFGMVEAHEARRGVEFREVRSEMGLLPSRACVFVCCTLTHGRLDSQFDPDADWQSFDISGLHRGRSWRDRRYPRSLSIGPLSRRCMVTGRQALRASQSVRLSWRDERRKPFQHVHSNGYVAAAPREALPLRLL